MCLAFFVPAVVVVNVVVMFFYLPFFIGCIQEVGEGISHLLSFLHPLR